MMKRILDHILASTVVLLLSPVLLMVAILVRIKLGASVLFRQVRPGLKDTQFTMIKFRSMRDMDYDNGDTLPDLQRLTSFGNFLRSRSLDKLPGLWNILKGDMSLIGPRLLHIEYLPLYSTEQARRHEVRPGIAGWAQINGRNAITWEQMFALDV